MSPGICTVQGDVNRHISEKVYLMFAGIAFQSLPLQIKHKLDDLDLFNSLAITFTHLLHGRLLTMDKSLVPFRPRTFTMHGFQNTINRIITKPAAVMQMQKCLESRFKLRVRHSRKTTGSLGQQSMLGWNQAPIINAFRRQAGQRFRLFFGQQAESDQRLNTDQHFVASKCG